MSDFFSKKRLYCIFLHIIYIQYYLHVICMKPDTSNYYLLSHFLDVIE